MKHLLHRIVRFLLRKSQQSLIQKPPVSPYSTQTLVAHSYEFQPFTFSVQSTSEATTQYYRNMLWQVLRAALRGDKEAQYQLGLSYLNGDMGLDRSYTHAEKWLDQAADQGHHQAKQQLELALNQLAFS